MEILIWSLLDIVLVSALLALAWVSLLSKDLHRAVVLFIAFGLLLALVWVRLRAPDVALAEAAIGAGLTGALLIAAIRDESNSRAISGQDTTSGSYPNKQGMLSTLLSLGLAIVLGTVFLNALENADPERLSADVEMNLEASGVSNPVTAVLLNFRAYDTFLELGVLLAAMLGILALGPARAGYLPSGPVLSGLTRWLVPLLIIVSGYLLWVGAHAPGGAFQAGAVLASAGILLRLAGYPKRTLPRGMALRSLSVAGVALFLIIGLAMMLIDRSFLSYPVNWAGELILAIEFAATLGVAVTLIISFMCGKPDEWTLGNKKIPDGRPQIQNVDKPEDIA